MLVTGVLSLLQLAHHSQCAPQPSESHKEESADAPPLLSNPFGSGDENRRLLQSYIRASVKQGQAEPELSTWEQEVFFLFSLHDYDRSGHMDGLEMMKLISDFNAHNAPGTQSADPVVSMVDFLLQTQDLNQDGLLAPSELLSPPTAPQDSNSHDAPLPHEPAADREPKEGEAGTKVEGEAKEDRGADEAPKVEGNQVTEGGQEAQPAELQETQEEERTQEDPPRVPEAPAAKQPQEAVVPVHQGQPEM